eukprot:TRINITY_DN14028_c0_g3_i1.p2 TRINITY_DN14028_c0_g3~~TRINITY_DN14028_c0_g3_i1.p2  ORF type:complete len:149 (+),score=22.45 TRINITY_DN14028_c0_g3_i1:37-447(+)
MDDTPGNIQSDLKEVVHPDSGRVHKQVQLPNPKILELPPGPVSYGDGLLHHELEPGKTVDVPTIFIDRSSAEESETGEVHSNTHHTKMVRSNVVALAPEHGHGPTNELRKDGNGPQQGTNSPTMGLARLDIIRSSL